LGENPPARRRTTALVCRCTQLVQSAVEAVRREEALAGNADCFHEIDPPILMSYTYI
jgi:hypothetical protein